MITSIVERIDRDTLPPKKSAAIDEAWSALAERWTAEEAARKTRLAAQLRRNMDKWAETKETPTTL